VVLRLDILLALAGLVTILPLIWFNLAARTLTLTALGFFQYIAPTLSFSLAVFFYGEAFTRGHAVAFGCIWFALLMVSFESLIRSKRSVKIATY
jgi:chloramphenicol-sensitive protein RarD